ncbi:hypothetical protein [Streptomyces sp. NPDC048603]|uniref:hypothetical protein n=1 Tax=Streptomyces sp. NPDC048603 TaxID=3365577 RepID=UPI00371F3F3C
MDVGNVTDDDVPAGFRSIAERGWTVRPSGARVLRAFDAPSAGPFGDVVQEEYSLNGRGMTDYDIPESGPEREAILLRRCVAYARACLRAREDADLGLPVSAYISVSFGGLEEDTLTANVTFCGVHPGVRPYLVDIEDFTQEAILVLPPSERPAG